MLRIIVSVALLVLTLNAGQAQAKRAYGMAGCGLGSLVFKPGGGQSSAATTNGSFYSQLFGITSGTSNCISSAEAAQISKQEEFIVANLGTLSKEIAQGAGNTLATLSTTLGCNDSVYPQFADHLQNGYSDIFAAPGAIAVLSATKQHLSANKLLKANCSLIHI